MRQRKQGECVSFIYESSSLIALKSRKVVFFLQCQFFMNCGSYWQLSQVFWWMIVVQDSFILGVFFQKDSGFEMAVQSLTRFQCFVLVSIFTCCLGCLVMIGFLYVEGNSSEDFQMFEGFSTTFLVVHACFRLLIFHFSLIRTHLREVLAVPSNQRRRLTGNLAQGLKPGDH